MTWFAAADRGCAGALAGVEERCGAFPDVVKG